MNFDVIAAYLPVISYLLIVLCAQLAGKKLSRWIHIAAVIVGLGTQIVFNNLLYAGLGILAGSLFFLLAVYIASGHITRSGIIVYSVTFAIAPFPNAWLGLLLGVFTAALVSLIVIGRKMGRSKAIYTLYESASSLGVAGGGIDPERIPAPKVNTGLETSQTSAGNMRLTPFILVGISVSMIVSMFY